jgi:hypothetical protein
MRLPFGIVASFVLFTGFAVSVRANDDTDYRVGETPLKTNWTDTVGTNPWPEHPRPRLQRSDWKNLNGVWRYRNTTKADVETPPFGERLEDPVLVPFCLESALSGILA